MSDPVIKTEDFAPLDSFDDQDKRDRLERYLLGIRKKLESLTADDLVSGVLDVRGPIDVRANQVSQIAEVFGVVNLYEQAVRAGVSVHTVIANMTSGGIALIPPDVSIAVSHTIMIPSDVQIVGSGPSSVLYQSPTLPSPNIMINATGKRRWAVRNVCLVGKRTVIGSGTAIVAKNTTNMQAEVENVVFGPQNTEGSVTFMWPDRCVSLSSVGGVKILACRITGAGDAGIEVRSSEDVEISGCKIVQCRTGIRTRSSALVRVINNRIYRSGRRNVDMSTDEHVVVFGNQIENASTSSPDSYDSVFGNDTSSMVLCGNILRDALVGGVLTTKYAVNHSATNRLVNGIMTCNYIDETSGLATRGRVSNMHTNLNVTASAGSVSGWVRDGNAVFPSGMKVVATYDGGWRGGAGGRGWNGRRSTSVNVDNPGTRFDQGIGLHGREHGRDLPGTYGFVFENAPQVVDWWSDTGALSDARRIQFDELVKRTSAPGCMMTPAVVATRMTSAHREIGAVHATYGMLEPRAGENPEYPAGLVRRRPQSVFQSAHHSTYYWSDPGYTRKFSLTNSQFGVYITSLTPYPFESPFTPHALTKYPGKLIVAWGGLVKGGNGGLGGPSGQGSYGQRPTWFTVHA